MSAGRALAEDWLVPESSLTKPAAPAKPAAPNTPARPNNQDVKPAPPAAPAPSAAPVTPATPAAPPAQQITPAAAAKPANAVDPAGLTKAADLLRLEQPALGASPSTQAFKAPPGETNRGANGLAVEFKNHRQTGSRWELEFRFTGETQGVTLVHPFLDGHCLLTLVNPGKPRPDGAQTAQGSARQDWALVMATRDRWADLGYAGQSNIPWTVEPGFEAAFPMKQKTWHKVQSQIDDKGRWQVLIDGQVVASANVMRASTMSMDVPVGFRPVGTSSWTANRFEGLSGRLAVGQGLVILNPGAVGLDDRGKASACNIFYGPAR